MNSKETEKRTEWFNQNLINNLYKDLPILWLFMYLSNCFT